MNRLCCALVAIFTTGCVTHIAPYRPKVRDFDPGEYAQASSTSSGSVFTDAGPGFFEDDRARRVGDVVIINIVENDSGEHDATTTLSKHHKSSMGMTGSLATLLQKAVPSFALSSILGLQSDFDFNGAGDTKRSGSLNGTLPVRVRKVLPNGDLYLEGHKVVMVDNEEHHLYVSGIIRQVDVLEDGSVPSSRVADAEIEYTGRGDIQDQQRPGWLHRGIGKVSPF